MRTRVRPTNQPHRPTWSVEVLDPHKVTRTHEEWIEIKRYHYFWYANWRANRLAKGSLEERFNVKERFLNRLKFGKEQNDNRT